MIFFTASFYIHRLQRSKKDCLLFNLFNSYRYSITLVIFTIQGEKYLPKLLITTMHYYSNNEKIMRKKKISWGLRSVDHFGTTSQL